MSTHHAKPEGIAITAARLPSRDLFRFSDIVTNIADVSQDKRSIFQLALCSKSTYKAVISRLYSHIAFDGQSAYEIKIFQQRKRLISTLQQKRELAVAVRAITTPLIPVADVTELFQCCPRLTSIRWIITKSRLESTQSGAWFVPNPLPAVPILVHYLSVDQRILTDFWPDSLEAALQNAGRIRHLSLFCTYTTAERILRVIGRQVTKLSLSVWSLPTAAALDRDTNSQIGGPLGGLLSSVPAVTHLRLSSTLDSDITQVELPKGIQKLSFETASFSDLTSIVTMLQNREWCPKLQEFPHVEAFDGKDLGRLEGDWKQEIAVFDTACLAAWQTASAHRGWKRELASIEAARQRVKAVIVERLRQAREIRSLQLGHQQQLSAVTTSLELVQSVRDLRRRLRPRRQRSPDDLIDLYRWRPH